MTQLATIGEFLQLKEQIEHLFEIQAEHAQPGASQDITTPPQARILGLREL